MSDTCLEIAMRRRIKDQDFEAVFAHGECFRFALRLHDRWQYAIHGIRAAPDRTHWGHVWATKVDGKGIDIRGIYPERILGELANAGLSAKTESVDIREARDAVASQGYPEDLSIELDRLADWIIDTHERFQGAKPIEPQASTAIFGK